MQGQEIEQRFDSSLDCNHTLLIDLDVYMYETEYDIAYTCATFGSSALVSHGGVLGLLPPCIPEFQLLLYEQSRAEEMPPQRGDGRRGQANRGKGDKAGARNVKGKGGKGEGSKGKGGKDGYGKGSKGNGGKGGSRKGGYGRDGDGKGGKVGKEETERRENGTIALALARAADFSLLFSPYDDFMREMWNSRERLRRIMHPEQYGYPDPLEYQRVAEIVVSDPGAEGGAESRSG